MGPQEIENFDRDGVNVKHTNTHLTFFLALLLTSCSIAADGQSTESIPSQFEEVQTAATTTTTMQDTSIENTQTNSGDTEGYLLFAPLRSTTSYLINYDGDVLHSWPSEYNPGNAVYLLENGNLLRTGSLRNSTFEVGGSGGIVQEIGWNGEIVWDFEYFSDQYLLHHDEEELPNGNILMIAWEYKTAAEAIAAGRNPNLLQDGELWPDKIIEADPSTKRIVWEWHVWDHLIQDFDAAKLNYGVPADHPELIDLNFVSRKADADWTHINSIDYNIELDQILLSVHSFSEIWIIDHGFSTEETAGSTGDLLYRWGNPQTYGTGSTADQQFFAQHDAQWIYEEFPGGGNILVFNNGQGRLDGHYSSVDEIVPPINEQGHYSLAPNGAYETSELIWRYVADNPMDFYADHISGAQRLSTGNTLICSGTDGRFFIVTPDGEIIWEYDYGGSVFRVTQISLNHPGLAGIHFQIGELLTSTEQGVDHNVSLPRRAPGRNNGPGQQPKNN